MQNKNEISTARIETFSDGVIAILITIMVFDLKLPEIPAGKTVWDELVHIAPKFLSYAMSFLVIGIMWVNHHQLFHQIRHADRRLLWYSLHLLFWISMVPFVTHFIGTSPLRWEASFLYGIIFSMCALSFMVLRHYVVKSGLLRESIRKEAHIRIRNKNRIATALYVSAAALSLVSVYISFALFLLVPAMYFVPEKIRHIEE